MLALAEVQYFGPFYVVKTAVVFVVPRPFLGLGAELSGLIEDYLIVYPEEVKDLDERQTLQRNQEVYLIVPDAQMHSGHVVLIHFFVFPARNLLHVVTVVDFLACEAFDDGLDQVAEKSAHFLRSASDP